MKLTFLSTSLLLAIIPHVFAAPAAPNAVSSRWVKSSGKTAPVVERAAITNGTEVDDDPDDDYIVVLADDDTRPWDEVWAEMGCNKSSVHKTMGGNRTSRAFTMKMKKSVGVSMFSLPNVAILEKDQKMHLTVMPKDKDAKRRFMSRDLFRGRKAKMTKRQTGTWLEQSTAPWNLQRVSSSATVQQNGRAVIDLDYRYRFEQTSGAGVDVYLLDTGINVEHVEFGGRAQMIFNVDGNNEDFEGHGTHTAGTVGSRTFGAAKNVNIFGLKVFASDGSGSLSDSINAIKDVVIPSHNQRKNNPGFRGSIVSMSLGAGIPSVSMEQAIKEAVDAGIHFSVAAGNEGQDACNTTPAGVSERVDIMTVGATDITDKMASFSNFGKCTNIYAPGVDVTSTFIGSNTAIKDLDGTSMACPLVTGLMAVELSINPDLAVNPTGLKNHMLQLSLKNAIGGVDPAPDFARLLANSGFPGSPDA